MLNTVVCAQSSLSIINFEIITKKWKIHNLNEKFRVFKFYEMGLS